MRRAIYGKLLDWKNDLNRKPLILFEARQGKNMVKEKLRRLQVAYLFASFFHLDKEQGKL